MVFKAMGEILRKEEPGTHPWVLMLRGFKRKKQKYQQPLQIFRNRNAIFKKVGYGNSNKKGEL